MGKIGVAFLVFSITMLHLSYGETISQSYSPAIWGTSTTENQNKNDNT